MKIKKIHLVEDNNEENWLEPSELPKDFFELYENELEDNYEKFDSYLPQLKSNGTIDRQTNLPITIDNDSNTSRLVSLSELHDLDWQLISLPYTKETMLKLFNSKYPEGMSVELDIDDFEEFESPEVSSRFIRACFNEEDLWEFFDTNDYSFSDCSWNLDDIDEDNLNLIESMGFPRDICTQLDEGTQDEDSPLSKYYDDLKNCVSWAYGDAQIDGAISNCIDDFNNAIKDVPIRGCSFIRRSGNGEPSKDKVSYLINQEFIDEYYQDIWDELGYYSDNFFYCIEKVFRDRFGEEFDFREPYNGWYGFNVESFNDSLNWRLEELKSQIEKDKTPEENLLNFNGETGEYNN